MDILLKMFRKDEGFTLVELMVVVLIIGILVAIAVPVFLNASAAAQAKSCQANQRTIVGAIQTYNSTNPASAIVGTAQLLSGNAYTKLFDTANGGTIQKLPVCPAGGAYFMGTDLSVTGDGGAAGFVNATAPHDHTLGATS